MDGGREGGGGDICVSTYVIGEGKPMSKIETAYIQCLQQVILYNSAMQLPDFSSRSHEDCLSVREPVLGTSLRQHTGSEYGVSALEEIGYVPVTSQLNVCTIVASYPGEASTIATYLCMYVCTCTKGSCRCYFLNLTPFPSHHHHTTTTHTHMHTHTHTHPVTCALACIDVLFIVADRMLLLK